MKRLWYVWWIGGIFSSALFGQSNEREPAFDPPKEYPPAVSFFATLFFPKILQDEYQLKAYICSDEFASFRHTYGDVYAVDALFDRAMKLSWNNVYEALLLSFVCSMDHRNFGLKFPLLGSLVWLPLTSEFPDEFQQRTRALPSKLYDDTPQGSAGDRDKLQHFFGSALLTFMFESREPSQRVGMFVEWGEDKFVIDGALDQRDIRANVQGQDFGTRLLVDASVLPSRFLGKRSFTSTEEKGCVPGEDTAIKEDR